MNKDTTIGTINRLALAAVIAALLVGCGGSNNGGDADDTGEKKDSTSDPITLQDCADCVDFVVDNIVLPISSELVADLSRDIDGDGKKDNAIGNLLSRLLNLYDEFDAQADMDRVTNEGDVVVVARLTATGGKLTEGDVSGQLWVADSEKCCDSDDPAECAAQARQSCFSGDYTFKPDTNAKAPVAVGTFRDGKLRLAGETVSFKAKVFGEPVTFEIRGTVLEGELDSDGNIGNGRISGVIDRSEISKTVVLQLANWINEQLADEDLAEYRDIILNVFDTNRDEVIGITEVTESDLLKNVFSGDVDADKDGVNEISVAFGYSAVPAKLSFGE